MASALDTFKSTFARARLQIKSSTHVLKIINTLNEEEGQPKIAYNDSTEVSDIARFGIILGVAAMDDYFTRKFAEVLVPCIKTRGVNKKMAEMLENSGLDLAGALGLLAMDRPYRRIRKHAQDFYETYSTQSMPKIDGLFSTLGIANLSQHAERRAKKKKLISSIEAFVKKRHEIAHAGDLIRYGKLQKVDLAFMKRLDHIEIFVHSCDTHINNFMNQKT
ncbi:MAG: hypothetical protein QM627_01775 [Luteolibacter sp.]